MEEEFQESDVVFAESSLSNQLRASVTTLGKRKHKENTVNYMTIHQSLPLDIPESKAFRYKEMSEREDSDNDGYEDIEGRRVPPHLIIARRINSVNKGMGCSFYVEDGKSSKLKGRNLFQVRNSILRLTGFIET